jgi:hypothetical protein
MTPLHTEKTEAFYQEVLKINLKSAIHSSRAHGLEEPLEQLRLEAEWSADEVAYALETRLTNAQLAGIEADVKAGCRPPNPSPARQNQIPFSSQYADLLCADTWLSLHVETHTMVTPAVASRYCLGRFVSPSDH